MPDEAQGSSPASTPATPDAASQPGPTINIGDEFGTARRNLPPAGIVLIALAIVAVVAAALIFLQHRQPSHASIDDVGVVEIPDQNAVLSTVNVTIHNGGTKSLYIHNMKVTISTDKGDFTDDAASPMDFDRYFQAFPALKPHAIAPLQVETKIAPGAEARGTIMVSFPVTLDAFNGRKSMTVIIQPYDDQPVEIKK
jgi:hypothetical protein